MPHVAGAYDQQRRQLVFEVGETRRGVEPQPAGVGPALDAVCVNGRRQGGPGRGRDDEEHAVLDRRGPTGVERHMPAPGHRDADLDLGGPEREQVPECALLVGAGEDLGGRRDGDFEPARAELVEGGDGREKALGDVAGEESASDPAQARRDRPARARSVRRWRETGRASGRRRRGSGLQREARR